MIYTITLNPALDRAILVERIKEGETNRILKGDWHAGGKGVNLSKTLVKLGIESTAMGFIGGLIGDELNEQLKKEGVLCRFIKISGETRTNIIIKDKSTGKQFLFSSPGPRVEVSKLDELMQIVKSLNQPDVVVVGGSLPQDTPTKIYRDIIEIAREKGAKVILDMDGDALRAGIGYKPDIIKPNIHEMGHLIGRKLEPENIDEILRAAREVNGWGAKIVLVSMGPKGILLVTEGKEYLAVPPEVQVKNTVSAGDSAVAGFIYGMVKGLSLKDSLICAVAAGTATTMSSRTSLFKKDDFDWLLPQIRLNVIQDNIVEVCQPKPVK